jgi:DNA-binding NarL/FixJ family response regulator
MFADALAVSLQSHFSEASIRQCYSLTQAIQVLEQATKPDLLILDLNMPGGSGLNILRSLAGEKRTAVIVCSGETELGLEQQCLEMGASAFWSKQGSVDDFLSMVEQVLSKDLSVHSSVKPCIDISKRQLNVLQLLAEGLAYKAIADALFISENTVKTHVRLLYQQLDVSKRSECIIKAKQLKLLD